MHDLIAAAILFDAYIAMLPSDMRMRRLHKTRGPEIYSADKEGTRYESSI